MQMIYSGSNRASHFKSVANPITPELYDMKSNYQLIMSITKFEVRVNVSELLFTQDFQDVFYQFSVLQIVEKQLKEPISLHLINMCIALVSSYSYPVTVEPRFNEVPRD